jgi:rhodanese-related sulfurtransferase
MFNSSRYKTEVAERLAQLEIQMSELKKSEMDLRLQTSKLSLIVRNLARKLVSRLPISIESLEKGLHYDLIFCDEIETWRRASQGGVLLDLRPHHEYVKSSLAESLNIPFDQLSGRLESLTKDQAVLLVCDNGIKSVAASEVLAAKGFMFLYVLKGGMSMVPQELKSEPRPDKTESRSSAADILA